MPNIKENTVIVIDFVKKEKVFSVTRKASEGLSHTDYIQIDAAIFSAQESLKEKMNNYKKVS
tara:strand:+ start:2795 stop:2980 length:186 start_codon:yes stop_codon:yes gene_type:complete